MTVQLKLMYVIAVEVLVVSDDSVGEHVRMDILVRGSIVDDNVLEEYHVENKDIFHILVVRNRILVVVFEEHGSHI